MGLSEVSEVIGKLILESRPGFKSGLESECFQMQRLPTKTLVLSFAVERGFIPFNHSWVSVSSSVKWE